MYKIYKIYILLELYLGLHVMCLMPQSNAVPCSGREGL